MRKQPVRGGRPPLTPHERTIAWIVFVFALLLVTFGTSTLKLALAGANRDFGIFMGTMFLLIGLLLGLNSLVALTLNLRIPELTPLHAFALVVSIGLALGLSVTFAFNPGNTSVTTSYLATSLGLLLGFIPYYMLVLLRKLRFD